MDAAERMASVEIESVVLSISSGRPVDLIVTGTDPVELRAFLKSGGETVTETWMFQYHPF